MNHRYSRRRRGVGCGAVLRDPIKQINNDNNADSMRLQWRERQCRAPARGHPPRSGQGYRICPLFGRAAGTTLPPVGGEPGYGRCCVASDVRRRGAGARFAADSGSTSNARRHRSFGAPGRTRTSTMFPPPDFESGASTNSATGAWAGIIAGGDLGSTARPQISRGRRRADDCGVQPLTIL